MSAYDCEVAAEYAERWRDGQLRAAAKLIREHPNSRATGKLPPEAANAVGDYFAKADKNAQRAESYRAIRDRHLALSVKSEPRTYQRGNGNSYYFDLARAASPGTPGHAEAVARLERYSQEIAAEAKTNTPEGRRALRVAETRGRQAGHGAVLEEQRAVSSGAASGGAFVTPQYLVDDWAVWRSYPPSFYEQSVKLEDVGYGLEIYLPAFTSGPTVTKAASEGAIVSNSSPGAGYLSAALVTVSGEVDISQQLFDRSGPLQFDSVIHQQLGVQLATAIDSYAIATCLATAGTVAGAATFSAAGLYGDLAAAKAGMLTTDGTKLPATHIFVQPDFAEWMLAQCDPNGRPLLLPAPANVVLPITPAADGNPPPGFTGTRLLSSAVFTDGSIPSSGSNTQILVANMGEVYSLASEPALRTIPETLAEELEVVVQVYQMVGVILRRAPAVQVVSGSGYLAAPTFS
jgi:hypothetical protein